ncbi:hypothetical protein CC1G_08767 [Coprinopsis cinerea okayama7|uniref:Uncharacterized protein n=1 Tax=Coprinopsis cinerea (strain Okayama-7 / 130 / ATCC MYA-4618 / FGSC 9003) TaxID=240176 RepID=A8NJ31_COPC7|nr:hypothetical protein CC1G_08767 [Coprinopsis cinerea okayama7\|eukprot:XP_001834136.2 hypothetical protein CC1G_08767 [Coprinopsis cinerea okayama7\
MRAFPCPVLHWRNSGLWFRLLQNQRFPQAQNRCQLQLPRDCHGRPTRAESLSDGFPGLQSRFPVIDLDRLSIVLERSMQDTKQRSETDLFHAPPRCFQVGSFNAFHIFYVSTTSVF